MEPAVASETTPSSEEEIRPHPWLEHLVALGSYLAIMLLLFGPKILPHLDDGLLAGAIDRSINDASIFVWNLSWWPHALGNANDPFYTTLVWAPTGINLAGTTIIPLPGILIAPVTVALGPLVSFNILSLLAPPTAAWTAYLLCRRVASFLPSVAGGFLFGFSSYEWLQTGGGHLNLSEVAFVPLFAYLVVRHLQGTLGAWTFVAGLAATLVAQFAISAEFFATLTVCAVVLGAMTLLVGRGDRLRRGLHTAGLMVLSYLLALIALAPYLYSLFGRTRPVKGFRTLAVWEAHAPTFASSVQKLVVPGSLTQVGRGVAQRLGVEGNGWYFGIPLLVVLGLCLWRERRTPTARILAIAFAGLVLVSFGPVVRMGGARILLPWALALRLPLIRQAVPSRLVVYAWLIAAVAVARWLGTQRSRLAWGAATLAGALVLPAISFGGWVTSVPNPPFFDSDGYRRSVAPGETVLIVTPYREKGLPSIWQAETGFNFRIASGFLGLHPPNYAGLSIARRLVRGQVRDRDGPAVQAFLSRNQVSAVIAFDEPPPAIDRLARVLGTTPVVTGGVVLFDLRA